MLWVICEASTKTGVILYCHKDKIMKVKLKVSSHLGY